MSHLISLLVFLVSDELAGTIIKVLLVIYCHKKWDPRQVTSTDMSQIIFHLFHVMNLVSNFFIKERLLPRIFM